MPIDLGIREEGLPDHSGSTQGSEVGEHLYNRPKFCVGDRVIINDKNGYDLRYTDGDVEKEWRYTGHDQWEGLFGKIVHVDQDPPDDATFLWVVVQGSIHGYSAEEKTLRSGWPMYGFELDHAD